MYFNISHMDYLPSRTLKQTGVDTCLDLPRGAKWVMFGVPSTPILVNVQYMFERWLFGREIPIFQGNLSWRNIMIWSDILYV